MDFGRQPAGAYTRVIEDRIGRGKRARKIRRPFFFERHTDRILELQTAYIDLEFGLASLNAQIAVLADLKVLQAWCALRKIQDPRWSEPQVRAASSCRSRQDAYDRERGQGL